MITKRYKLAEEIEARVRLSKHREGSSPEDRTKVMRPKFHQNLWGTKSRPLWNEFTWWVWTGTAGMFCRRPWMPGWDSCVLQSASESFFGESLGRIAGPIWTKHMEGRFEWPLGEKWGLLPMMQVTVPQFRGSVFYKFTLRKLKTL